MIGYLVRRIFAVIPVLLLVAVAVFSLLQLTPGDPAQLIAGDTATPEQIQAIREKLHLDQPPLVQAMAWGSALAHGDLGTSLLSGVPVTTLIAQRIEPTLMLALLTIILAVCVGVPLGTFAATRVGSLIDRLVMLLSVMAFSVPVFILAYGLVYFISLKLHWLPAQGYKPLSAGLGATLNSLMLPAVALCGVYMAQIARVTRAAVIEVLTEDFIRTARAKGLSRLYVLIVHALPNAAIPIVTIIGFGVGGLLGGVVVTETVFNIPGLGQLAASAILQRDYPIIQALTLLFAVVYVLVNLLVDLSYGLFDPRVRLWKAVNR